MNRIIVATDYSAAGQNAMLYAAEAAATHNMELVLFHLHNISIHALNARLSVESMDSILRKPKIILKTALMPCLRPLVLK